jgi:hypothetical protein
MKSRAHLVILDVLQGLLKDATAAFPELKGSFSKDFERIALCCESRGLGLFTLDLPQLASHLLDGLRTGRLRPSGPLSRRVSKEVKVPRLFSGLWLRVFRKDSILREEVDVNAVAFLEQLCRLGKNVTVECSLAKTRQCQEDYHDIEKVLRPPTLEWAEDVLSHDRAEALHLTDACLDCNTDVLLDSQEMFDFLGRTDVRKQLRDRELLRQCQLVADLVSQELGVFLPLQYSTERESEGIGSGLRHGPGAVSLMPKSRDKHDFFAWSNKLEGVFPYKLFGLVHPYQEHTLPANRELPSRLLGVPKSAKAPRLIAAEPVEHQWCQQLIWSWIRHRVDGTRVSHFLDFRKQELSGALVIQASLDRKLATVDLSSASDRLTCWTVERVFRCNPSFLRALHAARTRWTFDNIEPSRGSFIKLKKFASQGTATTFPVQSLVFLIIALASALGDEEVTWKNLLRYRGKVRVYGDDIVVPTHGYARLIRTMEILQLKVNDSKSYALGSFRESCGTRGYAGYDITCVSPKVFVADGPASVQAVIDTTNNLFYKGYWHASTALERYIPPRVRRGLRYISKSDAGISGLATCSGTDESHLRRRWNSTLHRHEVRVWQNSASSKKRPRDGYTALLDFLSRPHNKWEPRVVSEYALNTRKSKHGLRWEPCVSRIASVNYLPCPRNRDHISRSGRVV